MTSTEAPKANKLKLRAYPAWRNLNHATGPAAQVATQVRFLLKEADWHERLGKTRNMYALLLRSGQWFTATPRAVSELLAGALEAQNPPFVLSVVADLIGADHERLWTAATATTNGAERAETVQAVASHLELLRACLQSEDVQVAAAAALVLGMVPELGKEAASLLVQEGLLHSSKLVQASCLLALGSADPTDHDVQHEFLDRPGAPHIVRGAAALSLLRNSAATYDALAEGIWSWLAGFVAMGHPPDRAFLPWFAPVNGQSWADADLCAVRALHNLVKLRGRRACEQLADALLATSAQVESQVAVRRCAKLIYLLGELDALGRGPVPYQHLSEHQAQFVDRLSAARLHPQPAAMPASGLAREKWNKHAKAGPLDAHLVREQLSGLDRWEDLVWCAAQSYDSYVRLSVDEVEAELAKLNWNDHSCSRVELIANDLVTRFLSYERHGLRPPFSPELSGLLLLPYVRAGHALKPTWDILTDFSSCVHSLEVLRTIPALRRDPIVLRTLDHYDVSDYWIDDFKAALPIVSSITVLAPTFTRKCATIDRRQVSLKAAAEEIRQLHPELVWLDGPGAPNTKE